MPREPLYPHVPGKKEPLYPHVTKGRQPATIPVGISLPEEGIYKPGDVFKTPKGEARLDFYSRYERNWVVTYEPEGKQVRLDVATMDKLVDSREWVYQLKEVDIDLLAATEGDPIRKFCCRICGECAPKELLEEGRFPDRIAWLRSHYKSKHPGIWEKSSIEKLPQTSRDSGWKEPFVFRGLKFREHSGGIGIQVYHPEHKKWYDIEGLNWRTTKDYWSHQPDVGLWRDRSYFGSIRFPESPLEGLPLTIAVGEMVSPEYRHLVNLVSEPLPKDAY